MKPSLLPGIAWAALVLASAAHAHPVAQGALELDVRADRIEIRARISNEQVFVAGTLGKNAVLSATLDDLFAAHGSYLGEHLHVVADGKALAGRVESVLPSADRTTSGFATYELRYDLASPPREISLREDLLNEIEFAPGNPWEATFVVRQLLDGRVAREGLLLTRSQPLLLDCAVNPAPALDRRALAWSYLLHGAHHILAGWDHLLFMSALVLATVSLWELVKVVTAFTIAHTVTLTLSVLDVVRLSPGVVEPMIAISIVFVAVENVVRPARARGPGRLAIAFGFGLFHGLGFAGGLLGAMQGLAGGAVAIALGAFSLGVELGHQAVVLPVFGAMAALRRAPRGVHPSAMAMRYGSCAIALAGMVYVISALRS